MPKYEIHVEAPKKLCRWCNAYITRQGVGYAIIVDPDCDHCAGTGDHNFKLNGHLETRSYKIIG